jgi:uncharacterized protein (TIGR00369 family)
VKFPTTVPFADALGFELLRFENGEAEISCLVRAEQCNSFGHAHGGLLMTLLDIVMLHAVRSPAAGETVPQPRCATVEMKTSFFRPASGLLRGHGRTLMRTGSLAFCEGSVVDESGEVAARGSATFKLMRNN